METLFSTGTEYPKPVRAIISLMLSSLRNNKPKSDDKCYKTNAYWITSLYDGTFLMNQFDMTGVTQYDMTGWMDKVKACAGSWDNVHSLISSALSNLEMSKKPQYLPFNKKFLDTITFSNFFEGKLRYNRDGKINCNFIRFINEPKSTSTYVSETKITNLKLECLQGIRERADRFCNDYIRTSDEKYWFWMNMQDWSRWLKKFRDTFPIIYGEFCSVCYDGNVFADYSRWLLEGYRKNGGSFIISTYDFKLSYQNSGVLGGKFRQWLQSGMNENRFDMLRKLPKPVDTYYTDESFPAAEVQPKKEKQVVNMDDLIIF